MEKDQYILNEFIEIWIEDGIIQAKHPAIVFSLEIAKASVAIRTKICGENSYPFFVDVTKSLGLPKETMGFLSSEPACRQIKASAILVSKVNVLQLWAINLWLRLHPNPVPTKLFTQKEQAIEWLQQHK